MFNTLGAIGATVSAKASYDDGDWCGTKPGPRPHIDLGGLTHILGGGGIRGDDYCGNGILKLHLPPPPPPPLGDAAGMVSHVVMNALAR